MSFTFKLPFTLAVNQKPISRRPIFVLHIWCGKIFAKSLSMINCYISQIQTRSQRVSLSTLEFSSPAFFGFQVHKRAVYVLLEILSGSYCLISIQNVSAQYHFCHILYGTLISPKTFFWKWQPMHIQSKNKLTVMQNLSYPSPSQTENLVCSLLPPCSSFVFQYISCSGIYTSNAKPLVLPWPEEIANEDH